MFQCSAVGVELILDLVALHAGQHIIHAVQLVNGIGLERVDAAGHQQGSAQVDGRPGAQGDVYKRQLLLYPILAKSARGLLFI